MRVGVNTLFTILPLQLGNVLLAHFDPLVSIPTCLIIRAKIFECYREIPQPHFIPQIIKLKRINKREPHP